MASPAAAATASRFCIQVTCCIQMGRSDCVQDTKAGSKKFPAAPFFEYFFSAPSCKKYSKNGAAGKNFAPSYFDPALIHTTSYT